MDTATAKAYATADRLTSIAWLLKYLKLMPASGSNTIDCLTSEMHDRINQVRNIDVLSDFICRYLDNYNAETVDGFIEELKAQKKTIKKVYTFPDGADGPVDYWEKAYA
eukprot:4629996-Prymnesium_polylepis.4